MNRTFTLPINQQKGKFRIHLVTTTLDYVVRSGRVPKAFGYLAKLIQLKPIVQIRDGVIKSSGKVILFADLINSFKDRLRDIKYIMNFFRLFYYFFSHFSFFLVPFSSYSFLPWISQYY